MVVQNSTVVPLRRDAIIREGLGWAWEPVEAPSVRFEADGIEPRGHELMANVVVRLDGNHLHAARYNLSLTLSRESLARQLARFTIGCPEHDYRWERLVEQFCVGVLRKEREGEPLQFTHKVARRPKVFLVDHLVIKGKTNLLFSPGGHGKGITAVGLTASVAARRGFGDLTVQEARSIYFDWEDQFEDYEDRLNAYCDGLGIDVPEIAYQRMHGRLADQVGLASDKIRQAGANFGVIDSMSAAIGSTDRGASWDAIAHRLFDALDVIPAADGSPMSWFIIGHTSSDGLRGPVGKTFGSIQIMNRARNAWELRATQEPGSPTVHLRMYDAKWNHTGLRRPLGFRMDWPDPHTVRVTSEDPSRINPQGREATVADLAEEALLKGPLSVAVLSVITGKPENLLRTELGRHPERFEKMPGGYWRLTSQAPATEGRDATELPW